MKFEEEKEDENGEIVKIKKEFKPTWIVDLTTYQFETNNELWKHVDEVSLIGKELKAK